MPGSRGPKPLFELLAERREAQAGSGVPVSRTDAGRDAASDTGQVDGSRGSDSASGMRGGSQGGSQGRSGGPSAGLLGGAFGGMAGGSGRLSVPVATVYASIAGVLLACLLTFLLGYRLGHDRGEAITERLRPVEVVPLVDPLLDSDDDAARGGRVADRGSGAVRGGDAGDASGSAGSRGDLGAGAGGAGGVGGADAVLTAAGVAADPRMDGHNYLELAVLTRAQAEAAVGFLSESGVEAIAVPVDGRVDRGGRGSNNEGPASRFRVVAVSLAIPSGRYSALASERQAFERRLTGLGRRWVAAGGSSDFRAPLWRRYEK